MAALQEKKPCTGMYNSKCIIQAHAFGEATSSFDLTRGTQVPNQCQYFLNGNCSFGNRCPNNHLDLCESCKTAEAIQGKQIKKLCTNCCLMEMDIDLSLVENPKYTQSDCKRECNTDETIVTQIISEETDTTIEDITLPSKKNDECIQDIEDLLSCVKIKNTPYCSPLVENVNDEDIILLCFLFLVWRESFKKPLKCKNFEFYRFLNYKPLPFPLRRQIYFNYKKAAVINNEDNGYYEHLVHSTKDEKGKEIVSSLNKYDCIIFVDFENYLTFFKDVKTETLTKRCLIWVCINAVTKSPSNSKIESNIFSEFKQHVNVLVSRAIGTLQNAADNVIFILIHQLDLRLPSHIKFAVISNDNDFHVLKDFKFLHGRGLKIFNPHVSSNNLKPGLSKGEEINEALKTFVAEKNSNDFISDNPISEFADSESVDILDASTMPINAYEFSEKSVSIIIYDVSYGSPEKQLKKASNYKKENLIKCDCGQVPITIMSLVLDLHCKFGKSAKICIYSGNKKRFASFEQQFYHEDTGTVEFIDYNPSKSES